MGTKMKGLLKGLRYISQIFDTDTKEQEMQIGYPTDVKHVAHIGWDGPSVNAPGWRNELRSSSVPLTAPIAGGVPPKYPSEIGGVQDSSARDQPEVPARRSSRHNASLAGHSVDSPHRESRLSRRHQSSGAAAVDSLVRESSEGSRHGRRHRGTAGLRQESTAGSGDGGGSQSQDGGAAVPKRDRPRRKTKGSSSGGGSVRSTSRSNAAASESEGGVESQSSYSAPSLKTTREEEGF
ncbi:CRIB domain-containing protein RIC7-like [Phoenix dactylifera]|uniref:CRIB domain-containing protein RIC7-like n=1 Tax=Phoenix dactylifera TaxID=42345 RepID=A0A8B8JCK2_PHODC|nr:CRIB domain-containing protein RIC7-like [Phoenix dactylifera]